MPTLDDEGFKSYLKQFRPMVPDALPLRQESKKSWPRRFALRMLPVGAAAIVILAILAFRIFKGRVDHELSSPASVEVVLPKPPLTMRDANALLASAPSYKAVIDGMAFHDHASSFPKQKQSAFAVLAKEKIKL